MSDLPQEQSASKVRSGPHRILLPLVFLLLVIAFIPTSAALLLQPSGWSWTGILSRNTADVNGYLSIIEEIRQGNWRTHNLFTAEPHPAFQIRPFYTILGFIGRFTPAFSNVFLLELGRFFSVLIFLFLLTVLIRRIFSERRDQCLSLVIVAAGSGLGWLHLTADPPDLRIVETSTFLTLISPALYCVSLALLTGVLLCLDSAWKSENKIRQWRYGMAAALLALWQGFDRPFLLGPLLASATFTFLWGSLFRRGLERTLIPVLLLIFGAVLAISYQAHVVSQIPVYAEWNRQHYLLSPGILRLLLSYGFLLPLAIIGIRPFFRTNPELGILLPSFIIFSFLFSRLPIQFQERFLEGSPLCLGLLASSGLTHLLQKMQKEKTRSIAIALSILMLIPSSVVAVTQDISVLRARQAPQYLPNDLLAGMKALRTLAPPGSAILSVLSSGNFIPAYSGRQVVLGHQIQTAEFLEKQQLVSAVFRTEAANPNSALLLRTTGASWLFWGPEERWLANGKFDPEKSTLCERKFSNRLVRIYRLKLASN